MMKLSIRNFLAATAFMSSLAAGNLVGADERTSESARPMPPDRQGIAPSTALQFSNSGLGRTGDFAGTIVDLSCDSIRPSGGSARCDTGEHYFALRIDGDRALYPLLLFGNPPSIDKLRAGDFTGRKVRITGVHYSTTGTILVSDIHPVG